MSYEYIKNVDITNQQFPGSAKNVCHPVFASVQK